MAAEATSIASRFPPVLAMRRCVAAVGARSGSG
eukprot:CAMPEP_0196180712 /NCGR_PEP_ID=MMETSP0911-20130528/24933_1 /TAXON_ID=49265 /ORGANISM="Thalassiosira rotula, Strain GSO102" /LENGTH=32 /DNA_ID= /DNA_START= /DNA_END= /DNA_ORIENTATION=